MDIEEMMERLLATINANQAKSDADRKADKEEMLAEIKTDRKAGQAEMRVIIKAWSSDLKIVGEETTACQGTMEAHLETEEPDSVDMTPEVADDQEVPREDAEVTAVGEPKKRRQDQRRDLAAVHRQRKQE
jgi:hypothetical protein